MADPDSDNPVTVAIEQLTSFYGEMADHPRRRPLARLFQARDNRELEQQVMTHFYYSRGEPDLGLRIEDYLKEGRDPPDYRCRDQHGRVVGIELVELVDQDERAENAHRLARVSKHGTHEHSLPVPADATPGLSRMLRERVRICIYSHKGGLQAIETLLNGKDAKLERKKQSVGAAWDYEQSIVLVFTNNMTIAEAGFYRAAKQHRFGPFRTIDRAFLVSEPFFGIGTPIPRVASPQFGGPYYGDGIIELPIASA